jgi:hypothetical protein
VRERSAHLRPDIHRERKLNLNVVSCQMHLEQCLAASIALAIGAANASGDPAPAISPRGERGPLDHHPRFRCLYGALPPQRATSSVRGFKVNLTVDALWVRRVLSRAGAAGMDRTRHGGRMRL